MMLPNMNQMNQFQMMQNQLNMQNFNYMNYLMQNQMMIQMMNQMNNFNNNYSMNHHNNISYNQFEIPPNQMELVNSIISFYKKNGNYYMDFDNPYQIKCILNLLEPNYPKLKYDDKNKIDDPLYYIKEPKILIKFINSDYTIYKVSIPMTITKYDLYTIAKLYKYYKYSSSDILLIHKNSILKDDETSIKCISENDEIRIIELRNYPDNTYYNLLNQRNTKAKKNIQFLFNSGKRNNMFFPEDTTISEMLKAFYLNFGLEKDYNILLYNSMKLNPNDNKRINTFQDGILIIVNQCKNQPYILGKSVEVHISYSDKEIYDWIFEIGLLNSVNYIIKKNESFYKSKIKKLMIEKKEINRKDESPLYKIGIKNNFHCYIEFEKMNK